MKIAYIAHPIGGDPEGNLEKIRAIVRHINLTEFNTVPFVPYYADVVSHNEEDIEQRARGIRNDTEILTRSNVVDELRLYGETISHGMKAEIIIAIEQRIPIIPMTTQTTTALADLLKVILHDDRN
jgi:hypothetical protein